MRVALLPVCLVLISMSTGCATVTRGTTDTLVIESEPSGADVKLSNGMTGKTPTSFKLPRKNPLLVKIEKEGYESLEVNITPQVSGAGGAGMAGNVLVGGIIGVAVDAGSGAMNDLKPNPVKVTLTRASSYASSSDPNVTERLENLVRLRKNGTLSESEYRRKRSEILKEI